MKNTTRLSTIALFAAALAATPASALSLNLGGDGPLVDLGNGNNADATVSVDTGNLLGGDGDDGASASGAVDVNLDDIGGDGGLLDLDGDDGVVNLGGNGGLINIGDTDDTEDAELLDVELGGLGTGTSTGGLLDLGSNGTLLDLGDGPLLDLSGDGDIDATIDIAVGGEGGLDLGSTGGLLDVGEDGLLGPGTDATIDLGDTDVLADVNLSGNGAPIVDVDLLNGEQGLAGTGLLPSTIGDVTLGGDTLATVSLNGTSPGTGGTGGTGGTLLAVQLTDLNRVIAIDIQNGQPVLYML